MTIVLLLTACKKDMIFTVSPSTAKVGETVCINLDNKSKSNDLSIDWGDGNIASGIDNAGRTFGACNVYSAAGNYTIKVNAKNYNEGTVTVTITP